MSSDLTVCQGKGSLGDLNALTDDVFIVLKVAQVGVLIVAWLKLCIRLIAFFSLA